mmetsp:Transcript_8887/g.29715  ORF Transcript_8887/g.29715 Transcript_8887/m.29715 type:complete len:201 (-) Transcript_8887:218-820(-)
MACTLSGCIPCAYKLVVQPFIKHEQPVQAEPSARRMHPHASSIKLASCSKLAAASDLAALLPKSSILTVGDGDLTFSINRTREVSDMGCRHLCLEMHVEEREGGGDGRERSAGAGGADASATKGGHDRQAERGGEETAEQQQQQRQRRGEGVRARQGGSARAGGGGGGVRRDDPAERQDLGLDLQAAASWMRELSARMSL